MLGLKIVFNVIWMPEIPLKRVGLSGFEHLGIGIEFLFHAGE